MLEVLKERVYLANMDLVNFNLVKFTWGNIPVTRELTAEEIDIDYEKNTGTVIAEAFMGRDENG